MAMHCHSPDLTNRRLMPFPPLCRSSSFFSKTAEVLPVTETNITTDLSALFERSHLILDLVWNSREAELNVRSIVEPTAFSCPPDWREQEANALALGPIQSVYVGTGDNDGISLPWFKTADAILLWAHTRPLVSEVAVAQIPLTTTCEAWTDESGRELVKLALRPAQSSPQDRLPLLAINYDASAVRSVSFPAAALKVQPDDAPIVSAPSYTYVLRKTALDVLASILVDAGSAPHSTLYNRIVDGIGFLFRNGFLFLQLILFLVVVVFARNRKLQEEALAEQARRAEVHLEPSVQDRHRTQVEPYSDAESGRVPSEAVLVDVTPEGPSDSEPPALIITVEQPRDEAEQQQREDSRDSKTNKGP